MNIDNARQSIPNAHADRGQIEPKPQAPPFVSVPASPPRDGAVQSNGAASALWIVLPALAAVVTAFSVLVCGGLSMFLLVGGSSDTYSQPQPLAYSDSAYSYSSDPYSNSTNYVPTSYAPETPYVAAPYGEPTVVEPSSPDPAYVAPTYVEPTYVEPAYSEPAYTEPASVDPGYADPIASSPDSGSLWSFDDPTSDLVAAIARDEEELVGMDAAILAARTGEVVGGVEAQDGETPLDQLVGAFFAVGADALEQQLLAERAVVQARLDANRAELVRLRGY